MHGIASHNGQYAIIAVMGATGTGKSTFIKHVTGDERIVIGHKTDSETSNVQLHLYTDPDSGIPVVLVDTPGFDDSRDGVTDTDILEKIAIFLQHEEGLKLNGIIYMHRISDNRVGGLCRKNLKMFRELCGDNNLGNVRIVTTYWDRVGIDEGTSREAELAEGTFRALITAGAKMARQDEAKKSALNIISELIFKAPVEIKLLEEIKEGRSLVETSAGSIINDDINRLQKQHERDLDELRKEIESAAESNEQLKTELVAERKMLEERMTKLEGDKVKLQVTRQEDLKKAALVIGGIFVMIAGVGCVVALVTFFELVELLGSAAAVVAVSLTG